MLSYAKAQMKEIKDSRLQNRFTIALRRLSYAPEQQGKQLTEGLADYYSVRVMQRYRILYHLREDIGTVFVLSIGIRKEGDKHDVYTQTTKFLNQGLFNLNIEIENIINATREERALTTSTEPTIAADNALSPDAASSPILRDLPQHEDS